MSTPAPPPSSGKIRLHLRCVNCGEPIGPELTEPHCKSINCPWCLPCAQGRNE